MHRGRIVWIWRMIRAERFYETMNGAFCFTIIMYVVYVTTPFIPHSMQIMDQFFDTFVSTGGPECKTITRYYSSLSNCRRVWNKHREANFHLELITIGSQISIGGRTIEMIFGDCHLKDPFIVSF